jgi:hypothetical protein
MNNSEIIQGSCFIVLVLLIWFKTNAFVEYCKLFNLKFLFDIYGYEEKRKHILGLTYPNYLCMTYGNMFFKILICEICSSVWLSFFIGVIFGFANGLVANIASLLIYYLINKLMRI